MFIAVHINYLLVIFFKELLSRIYILYFKTIFSQIMRNSFSVYIIFSRNIINTFLKLDIMMIKIIIIIVWLWLTDDVFFNPVFYKPTLNCILFTPISISYFLCTLIFGYILII